MPTMGALRCVPHRAVERGIAETEDATVGSHQPVAPAVGRRGHADDGCVEVRPTHRAVELCAPGDHEGADVGGKHGGIGDPEAAGHVVTWRGPIAELVGV